MVFGRTWDEAAIFWLPASQKTESIIQLENNLSTLDSAQHTHPLLRLRDVRCDTYYAAGGLRCRR